VFCKGVIIGSSLSSCFPVIIIRTIETGDSLLALRTLLLWYFFIYLWGWSGTRPGSTGAAYWTIVPALDDTW
jgi:hypothetical protein